MREVDIASGMLETAWFIENAFCDSQREFYDEGN